MVYENTEHANDKPRIYEQLATLSSEALFEGFNAKRWVERYRVGGTDGSLDMQGTAEKLGIPLAPPDSEYELSPIVVKAYITGVSMAGIDDPVSIHISPYAEEMARMSFGHELGHFFLFQQGYLNDNPEVNTRAEQFCDVFGRECALPSEYLKDIDVIDGPAISALMDIFKVDYQTVLMQLVRAGKLPKAVLIDVSFGETANPTYRNRLTRIGFCYDCEMSASIYERHVADSDTLPVIDMSYDSQMLKKMSLHSCLGVESLDLRLTEAVEQEHGRV